MRGGPILGGGLRYLRTYKMRSGHFRRRLNSLPLAHDEFVVLGLAYDHALIWRLCADDDAISRLIEAEQLSTRVMAIALGIAVATYRSIIVSGFSFEIIYAYARNPQIEEMGITNSQHAGIDIAVLSYLVRKYGTMYSTDAVARERDGVPLMTGWSIDASAQSAANLGQPPQSQNKPEYIAQWP